MRVSATCRRGRRAPDVVPDATCAAGPRRADLRRARAQVPDAQRDRFCENLDRRSRARVSRADHRRQSRSASPRGRSLPTGRAPPPVAAAGRSSCVRYNGWWPCTSSTWTPGGSPGFGCRRQSTGRLGSCRGRPSSSVDAETAACRPAQSSSAERCPPGANVAGPPGSEPQPGRVVRARARESGT